MTPILILNGTDNGIERAVEFHQKKPNCPFLLFPYLKTKEERKALFDLVDYLGVEAFWAEPDSVVIEDGIATAIYTTDVYKIIDRRPTLELPAEESQGLSSSFLWDEIYLADEIEGEIFIPVTRLWHEQ